MTEVLHWCANCERVTEGHWARLRSGNVGGDIAFACDDCGQLTHPDYEGP